MRLRIASVGWWLQTALVTGCLAVGDSLVVIEGRVLDQEDVPYERCEAALLLADSKEELESVTLDNRRLKAGRFSLSFHVPGRWADCYFTFSCDGAVREVSSRIVRRGYENPVGLGDVVLTRSK